MTHRRFARFDDDDAFDAEVFDPKYYPKRVYRDGKGPTVRLMLTDAIARDANGVPPSRPALYDTRNRRPRFAVLGDAELQDARRRAAEARQEYIARICDAHRGPGAELASPPMPGETARDAYVRRLQNAWKEPIGRGNNPGAAEDIEREREQWLSPGARPGVGGARLAVSREMATSLADARAARDAAYDEMVKRNANAWRTR